MPDDFSTLPGYGLPLYGSPAPRDALVQALLSGSGNMAPQPATSAIGDAANDLMAGMKSNPKMMDNLKKWFSGSGAATPSDTVPGTGWFGTNLFGTSLAQGAAPGPNQIIPM
jgi:hypothetical protein